MENHHHISRKELRKAHNNKCARGALSNISENRLINYYAYLCHRRILKGYTSRDWLPSIQRFNRLIQGDPVLRMNWEYGIFQCKKKLAGKTGDDVLDMIDTACKTPPDFSNDDLVGFPINAIFVEFMQNENGRAFFSDERVN
jgi:phosphatidylserine decarboxylase